MGVVVVVGGAVKVEVFCGRSVVVVAVAVAVAVADDGFEDDEDGGGGIGPPVLSRLVPVVKAFNLRSLSTAVVLAAAAVLLLLFLGATIGGAFGV